MLEALGREGVRDEARERVPRARRDAAHEDRVPLEAVLVAPGIGEEHGALHAVLVLAGSREVLLLFEAVDELGHGGLGQPRCGCGPCRGEAPRL